MAEFVAKIDNDCLVSSGWLGPLTAAHRDCETLGAVACWHFRLEDFDENSARHKMRQCNGHSIFQHPWVCGSGFVMKRRTYLDMGPWPEGMNAGATGYFLKMALRGYINGWYYPLILQHHMEDPLSPYCSYHDDASLQQAKAVTFTLRENNINTMAERLRRRDLVLKNLMCGSPHPRDYAGWRGRLKRHLPAVDRWRQTLEDSVRRPGQ